MLPFQPFTHEILHDEVTNNRWLSFIGLLNAVGATLCVHCVTRTQLCLNAGSTLKSQKESFIDARVMVVNKTLHCSDIQSDGENSWVVFHPYVRWEDTRRCRYTHTWVKT